MRKYGILPAEGIIYTAKRKGDLLQKVFLCIHAQSNMQYIK